MALIDLVGFFFKCFHSLYEKSYLIWPIVPYIHTNWQEGRKIKQTACPLEQP